MRIEPISASGSIDQAMPLIEAHYDEIARNKRVMVLQPDREAYARLDAAGMLVSLGAFDSANSMVGYCVTMIAKHLHYDLTYAVNDVLFVAREHRSGRTGLRLVELTEHLCRERGARLMLWHAKPNTVLDAILPRLGYGVQDIIHSKEL